MRKLSLVFCLVMMVFGLRSQSIAPYINYQGVARSSSGLPIVGNIGIKLELHQGSQGGTVVFTEPHSVTTNSFGIFNLLIGSQNASGFSAINWGQGPYYLEVSIDPNGGTSYTSITNQIFASVPYALFAKDAANVKEYVAGSNISISAPSSGNTYTINSLGSSSSNATITLAPNSHQVTSNGNLHQLTIASPSFANSTNAVSMTGAFPNYVLNYQYPTLSVSGNSILSISQGTYTSPAITLTNVSSGPWSTSLTNAYLSTGYDNVGIGTSAPVAKLDIFNPPASTNNAIGAHSQGGNGIFVTTLSTNTTNAAIIANNNGSGSGVFATASNPSSFVSGVQGINTGGGAGVFGNNTSGSSSTGAHGVNGKTNGTAPFASGVMAESYGNGPGLYGYQGSGGASSSAHGVYGVTNSSAASGVYGTNSSTFGGTGVSGVITSGLASSNSHGVRGETNGLSIQAAGVFGDNKGQGAGVVGSNTVSTSSTGAHGVRGITNSSNNGAAGVSGENLGTGAAILGLKPASATSGHAARFEVFGNTNSSEAVYITHAGTGMGVYSSVLNNYAIRGINNSAAVAAISANNFGTSFSLFAEKVGAQTGEVVRFSNSNAANANAVLAVANSGNSPAVNVTALSTSTLLMQFNDGHLKSTGAVPVVTTFSNTGGISTLSYSLNTCTDIKGNILAVATTTGIINIGGYATIRVSFNKSYITPPIVVVTPTTDFGSMSYFISNVTPTAFFVTIKNNTTGNIPGSNFNWGFNYMVIE
jgi:hypothetical protein